jgi:hypothetical protein
MAKHLDPLQRACLPSWVLMASSFDGCLVCTFLTVTGCSTLAPTSTWQDGTALPFTLHQPNRRRARPTIAAAPARCRTTSVIRSGFHPSTVQTNGTAR